MRIFPIALVVFFGWATPSSACVNYTFGNLDGQFAGFGRFVNNCAQTVVVRFEFDNGSDGIAGPILRGNTELYYHGRSKRLEYGWCETSTLSCSPPNTDGSLTNVQKEILATRTQQNPTGPHSEYVGIWSQHPGDIYGCWRGEPYTSSKTGSMAITPDGQIKICTMKREEESDRYGYPYAIDTGKYSLFFHNGIRYLRNDSEDGSVTSIYASPQDFDRGAVPLDMSADIRAGNPLGTYTAKRAESTARFAENMRIHQENIDRLYQQLKNSQTAPGSAYPTNTVSNAGNSGARTARECLVTKYSDDKDIYNECNKPVFCIETNDLGAWVGKRIDPADYTYSRKISQNVCTFDENLMFCANWFRNQQCPYPRWTGKG